jgi:nucleoside-diphosphate-sugar epimerase
MTIKIDKARQELGYSPVVSIDEGLERLRSAA